jgi:hypothetical protein
MPLSKNYSGSTAQRTQTFPYYAPTEDSTQFVSPLLRKPYSCVSRPHHRCGHVCCVVVELLTVSALLCICKDCYDLPFSASAAYSWNHYVYIIDMNVNSRLPHHLCGHVSGVVVQLLLAVSALLRVFLELICIHAHSYNFVHFLGLTISVGMSVAW